MSGRRVWLMATAVTAVVPAASAADVTNYLRAIDRNGDELVTVDELAAAPALVNFFSAADKNGDGHLDAREFEQLLRRPTSEEPAPQS